MILKSFFNKPDGKFQMNKLMIVVCLFFGLAFLLINCSTSKIELSPTDKQIKFYQNKITGSKNHYPSYALLGNAYLAKARETGEPKYLAEARKNINKSLEIQPNYQAFKTMALISNYSHHFAEASEWAKKAAEASPEGLSNDAEVTSILIEAYLGLGQNEKAETILNELAKNKPNDFSTFTSFGHFYKAENRVDEAVKVFENAATAAGKQNAVDLVVWANVTAAGCLIDSGRSSEAKPFLDKAANISPENKLLLIHQAEISNAENRPQEALDVYEKLLKTHEDAEIHHQAFLIAQKLNNKELAEKHFRSAETGFQKILESGEIYTLEPLAKLYCDANKNLPEAEKLAQKNLKYKMDNSAKKTLQCISEKL